MAALGTALLLVVRVPSLAIKWKRVGLPAHISATKAAVFIEAVPEAGNPQEVAWAEESEGLEERFLVPVYSEGLNEDGGVRCPDESSGCLPIGQRGKFIHGPCMECFRRTDIHTGRDEPRLQPVQA